MGGLGGLLEALEGVLEGSCLGAMLSKSRSEVFVIYFQSAVGPRDVPCVPVLTLAKEDRKRI